MKLADLPKLRGRPHYVASAHMRRRMIWDHCKANDLPIPEAMYRILTAHYFHHLWKVSLPEAITSLQRHG